MDFSGIFTYSDVFIFQLMAIELAIGCFTGLIVKQVVKIKAKNDVNIQIVSPDEYSSIHFGNNIPKDSLDIFLLLPTEFILLTSEDNQIVCEDFRAFFGSSRKAKYESGILKSYGSFDIEPVYLCTVLIPIAIGFFLSFSSLVGEYFRPVLYSGFLWIILVFLLQFLVGRLNINIDNRG
jgi:hypothetical protein